MGILRGDYPAESSAGEEDAGRPVVGASGHRAAGPQKQGMESKLLAEDRKVMSDQ